MTRCHIEFYDEVPIKVRDGKIIARKCVARIYKHADGYAEGKHGIIAELTKLHRVLSLKDPSLKKQPSPLEYQAEKGQTLADYARMFGARTTDGEWAAAAYINLFRIWANIYVSQKRHGDVRYIYFVDCSTPEWTVYQTETDDDGDPAGVPTLYAIPPKKPTPQSLTAVAAS
jgi:hypothetical protein